MILCYFIDQLNRSIIYVNYKIKVFMSLLIWVIIYIIPSEHLSN